MGEAAEWVERWEAALDELELDLDRIEEHLRRPSAELHTRDWVPPSELGPVPAPVQDRASAVHRRQVEVARRITESLTLNRRHAKAARGLRAGTPATPVYIDTTG